LEWCKGIQPSNCDLIKTHARRYLHTSFLNPKEN
jgi:hypothetical protein